MLEVAVVVTVEVEVVTVVRDGDSDGTTECSPSRLPDVGPLSQAVSTEIPYHDDMG
ncbi:hypothetical protein Taro_030664 [Colocasia esculenta]|uniref:Uncharacterized protein n=1 Tax=Colocasia esculenta TaxID=4460 RepID=A0A843W420_COLES|nr:hypothetical protein [Colocasia esculenta]